MATPNRRVHGEECFMLKVGWKASAEQFGPRELVDHAVRAERAGLDSVFISDHFQPWRHNDGHAPFAMSWLAAASRSSIVRSERTSEAALNGRVGSWTGERAAQRPRAWKMGSLSRPHAVNS